MNKSKKGFTLVELLIAMVVGMIIMAAIYAVINLGQGTSANIGRRVLTQQDARAVMDLMAMEIRMASFNPNFATTTWNGLMSGSCNATTMVQVRRGIQVATANQIGVAMDLSGPANAPSGIIGDAQNEYIVYNYNAANGAITRNVSCGGNETILGGANSSTMVRNDDAAMALFEYFNINGTDISANVINSPNDPNIGINAIRRVRINIVVDVENEERRGALRVSRRTYSTDTLVRNHAL